MDDLLYDVPGSSGIVNCPLLLIQVTRLLCGGFTVAIRFNHTMCDGPGFIQFLTAVSEIACGVCVPSIRPIWKRELLSARNPPQVSCEHHIYQELPDSKGTPLLDDMVQAQSSFFFGPEDIAVLRSQVPPHLRKCSRFEIISACLWRCRTMALSLNPNDEVRLACIVNSRTILNPPLPVGFYGNAFGFPVARSTAGKLCQNPLGYALELVKKAKADGTEEFMRSTADLLVEKGRLQYVVERTYIISDVTRLGFTDIDFGWGKPVFSGPTGAMPLEASIFVPLQNKKGENGIVATINLPTPFMVKLFREIEEMIKEPSSRNLSSIRSSL
ncbi:Benzyl alcohol o-benzoyltransferase [Thalictrum thalictroides]|uniref:Benzyl alcohol o-benzoyltransferase n=1 Tax=Thalictrum thalictroides TaxID=46969 RepID=A0A7J6WN84_THATH|nr:Benzyl alcohol o-benzoyltransferase [Thalictrum thalictroides]